MKVISVINSLYKIWSAHSRWMQ